MNFKELKGQTEAHIHDILHLHRSKSPFWEFYSKIRTQHQEYFRQAKKKDLNSNQFQHIHTNFVNSVNNIVQQTDLGQVFVSLNDYIKLLQNSSANSPLIESSSKRLVAELEEIWGKLNELMRKPNSFPLIIEILERFESIDTHIIYFKHCYQFLEETGNILNENLEPSEGYDVIDIGFSIEIQSLTDLNTILQSIIKIYAEACFLFGVSESDFPLTIAKIESGSLWTRLFGENRAVDFVIWFLKGGIRFLHRSFTNDGKLKSIPSSIELLDQELELHQKLKELMPEERYQEVVAENAAILAKSCVILSKNTQNLLQRETKLRIGSEVIAIEFPVHQKYLEAAARQLPEGSDTKSSEIERNPK